MREGGREGGIGRLQKRNRQKVEIMRWQIRKMENGGMEIRYGAIVLTFFCDRSKYSRYE